MLAAFLAAYLSTISTQLNWGASYLVNDFYRRFIRRDGEERDYVRVSRMATLLIMALSRYREYAADRGGAMLTGAPMQLASALTKISNDMYRIPEKDLRQIEHANAFMFVPALKGKGIARLFSSHPSTEDRIERLRNMQRDMDRGTPFRI